MARWKQVGLVRASLIVYKWVLQLLGTVFLSHEDAWTQQSDLWGHKIQLKYLEWSVLAKWLVINLKLPECIPSGQFNCQLETTSQQLRCQKRIFNASDVRILRFAIMQHHRIDWVWGTVFHNVIDVPLGTQQLMRLSSRLNLDSIKLASSDSWLRVEQTLHEIFNNPWNNQNICGKSWIIGHRIGPWSFISREVSPNIHDLSFIKSMIFPRMSVADFFRGHLRLQAMKVNSILLSFFSTLPPCCESFLTSRLMGLG